ncbi:MAG: gamma-glutamyltransferase [Rhodanobacteraceae bacterium]|nr:gamma-glutamyltransferase [Rhodanobacteraceae bacterium]MBL0041109.1 gamma-glutamyltransferase [Xanthomonadales bacterium]
MKIHRYLGGLALGLAFTALAIAETPKAPGKAAIASAHHLATDAGFEVLAAGGNAFDAAIAVTAALAVVESSSSGIGGGGFWLLHRASDGKEIMIDGRESAPLAVDAKAYLDAAGQLDRDKSVNGALAGGIPGEPAALVHLAQHYGRLPLKKSLAPAIRLARDGFPLEDRLRGMLAMRQEVMLRYPASRAVFFPKGELLPLGTLIKQPDLASTLEAIADRGFDGFYKGKLARKLVDGVRAQGGNWTLADLANYKAIEREPLRFDYRGVRIVTAAPPSSGGVLLATILNIVEGYDYAKLGRVDRIHVLTEAMRRAYRDRSFILGDPDFVQMPIRLLTSKDYAAGLRGSIRMDRATPSSSLPEGRVVEGGTDTTHFSVIDADGNMAAVTASVNLPMGSGFIIPGTGVLLNNEMDDFALAANQANAYGLIGTDANAPKPGKRMLSTMSPTFAFGPDRIAVIGTPGGSRIATMVLIGLIEFVEGRSAAEVVATPRFHHQYLPDAISAEAGAIAKDDATALRARGHVISDGERPWGNMNLVVWDLKSNTLSGASDPRGVVGKADVR